MVITLDGPSATGKSTLAKIIAQKLGFKFLNSGMIYRAITYYYLKNNITADMVEEINNTINNLQIDIAFENDSQNIYVNKQNLTQFVSQSQVNESVSLYSQILSIRQRVLLLQRDFASNNNIVIEGRDIGSEVFPNAMYKFYVTCDINIRAKRRLEDLKGQDSALTLCDVIKSLENRDYIDKTRRFSPLVRPKDAIDIDTSYKTIDECVEQILSYVKL